MFLYDSNGDKWLFCMGCKGQFHLNCIDNLPKGVEPEEIGQDYCSACRVFWRALTIQINKLCQINSYVVMTKSFVYMYMIEH